MLFAGLQLSAQTFHFQLFDVPNSASTEADNINARGNIAGFIFDHAGHQHGFFLLPFQANSRKLIFPAQPPPRPWA